MNKPLRQGTANARPASGRAAMLTRDSEAALARAWRDDGSIAARNRLVEAFAPLAVSMARRFSGATGVSTRNWSSTRTLAC